MIAKAYNPKDTIEKKRALLEGNLYAASSLPEDLFKDAEWLDSGHVGSKLRREFTIKYLLRCAYQNYIPALMKFVFLYEVVYDAVEELLTKLDRFHKTGKKITFDLAKVVDHLQAIKKETRPR